MPITGSFIVPHPPLIIPDIGKGQESGIQSTINACREVAKRIAVLKPETIIVTTPHSIMYQDYFHISPGKHGKGDFGNYRAGNVQVETAYDMEFVSALELRASRMGIPAGTYGERTSSLDHGAMIPLYFVNQCYQDYEMIRIGLSGLPAEDHYRLGMCIAETVRELERNVVFIASGDLSHKLTAEGPYGFSQEGSDFDRQVTQAMAKGDFLTFLQFDSDFLEKAAECGLKSFQIMAGALDRTDVESELLSYEGPFGVGYAVAAFRPLRENQDRDFLEQYGRAEAGRLQRKRETESEYVRLARYTLEHYVMGKKHSMEDRLPELPDDLPANFLSERAGVFVSIKRKGNLRGCIGTISPRSDCIAEEIRSNAISAGTKDPRFDPIQESELKELEYSVDVLAEPEPIESAAELDVKRYGVIVSRGRKQGLLLPDLAGVDTVEEQIRIAKQKAGIREGEPVQLERFKVVRYL